MLILRRCVFMAVKRGTVTRCLWSAIPDFHSKVEQL